MQLLAPVRFFSQCDVCFACVSQSVTLLQRRLLCIQCFPGTTTRFMSGTKSVEKKNNSDDLKDKKKKGIRKKYVYYDGGKPKYSTGEPLSKRHVSRISDKHFFGPLLETKKERVSREKREEINFLQNDANVSSSENLLERILETTRRKKKTTVRFAEDKYDGVPAVYSALFNTSKQVKINTCKALNIAKENLTSDSSFNPTHHVTYNACNGDVSASSASTSGTEKHSSLSAELLTIQTTGSDFESVQPALSTSPNLIEVDNSKYVDAPRYLDLHRLHSFPLFKDNKNPPQSPFNAYYKINSGVESLIQIVEEGETYKDWSTNHGITSIGYRASGSKSLPSVSRILNETMPEASKIALAKWEAKMISELGEQGFQDYKKELFSQGSLLHECIHAHLQHSQPPSASALLRIEGFWRSVEPVVAEVRQGEYVAALESRVIHPHLHYGGVLDCVAMYRNTPVIVEWKTSTKPKQTLKATYDNPLQVAAYLGALQHDPAYRHLQVQSGLLVFAYSDGSRSDTHVLSRTTLERYWCMWLARLAAFWKINSIGSTVREEAVCS